MALNDVPPTPRPRSWLRWALLVLVVVLVAAVVPLWRSSQRLERVAVDAPGARERLASERPSDPPSSTPSAGASPTPLPSDGPSPSPVPSLPPAEPLAAAAGQSFLIVGSDARVGLGGSRADVIMLAVLPSDGGNPVLFSLPRDLWLPDPCRGGSQRINAALNGCAGVANGFELTSIVVEDFTGIAVDHVIGIDFEGFQEVIDAVGGIQVCVTNPVREGRRLSLPAGCSQVGGETALRWVRSRKTQELVDGRWRTMPGVNDLTRNRRQQDVMVQLLSRVGSFGTVTNLYDFADGVSDSVTLGSTLSVLDGAQIAWGLRGRAGDIERFSIPVRGIVTSGGAQVLVPTESFASTYAREVG